MATIGFTAPARFIQGVTVQWRARHVDYDPATWSLEAAFVAHSDARTVAATDYGDGSFLVEISSTVSAEFEPGVYRYQLTVSSGSQRFPIGGGVIECVQDYANVSDGHDGRSPDAVIYDAITAVMQGKATQDQSNLAIGGRSLSRYTWDELIDARGYHAHQMHDEERMARGYMPRQAGQVRFTR